MNKLTESDICHYYMPIVLHECYNAYKGLEWDDRVAEGELALIYAIRTYRIKYGCFTDYLTTQIRRILTQKNQYAWHIKKLDSRLSLDAPLIQDESNYTLQSVIYKDQSYEPILEAKFFIETLSTNEKCVLKLLFESLSDDAISDNLKIPVKQVKKITNELKRKYLIFFRDE